MFIYNIAIRWHNGELEGFGASALTEHHAKARALQKAVMKSHDIAKTFTLLSSDEYQNLSVEEQDSLTEDWGKQYL